MSKQWSGDKVFNYTNWVDLRFKVLRDTKISREALDTLAWKELWETIELLKRNWEIFLAPNKSEHDVHIQLHLSPWFQILKKKLSRSQAGIKFVIHILETFKNLFYAILLES